MSQDSALDSQELDDLQESVKPANTKKSTSWGVKVFQTWSEKRELNINLATVSCEVLADSLRRFYAEVKTKKGLPMTPASLTCLRASLHRYLTEPPLNRCINIITDSMFIAANNMFNSKQKLFRKSHNSKPKHKPTIEDGDLQKMRTYFSSNLMRPEVNQEMTWFNLCYYFGRRGREGWRDMSKETFAVRVDDMDKRYIAQVETESTKNHQSENQDSSDYSDIRVYEQQFLCPVASFEKHLKQLNDKCDALGNVQKQNLCVLADFVR